MSWISFMWVVVISVHARIDSWQLTVGPCLPIHAHSAEFDDVPSWRKIFERHSRQLGKVLASAYLVKQLRINKWNPTTGHQARWFERVSICASHVCGASQFPMATRAWIADPHAVEFVWLATLGWPGLANHQQRVWVGPWFRAASDMCSLGGTTKSPHTPLGSAATNWLRFSLSPASLTPAHPVALSCASCLTTHTCCLTGQLAMMTSQDGNATMRCHFVNGWQWLGYKPPRASLSYEVELSLAWATSYCLRRGMLRCRVPYALPPSSTTKLYNKLGEI